MNQEKSFMDDLLASIEKKLDKEKIHVDPADIVTRLQKAATSLLNPTSFNVGDLVCIKKGLKNKRLNNGIGIVTKVLDEPILGCPNEYSSCYFREPLDVVVGSIDREGDFLEHHYDSRRLEHYKMQKQDH